MSVTYPEVCVRRRLKLEGNNIERYDITPLIEKDTAKAMYFDTLSSIQRRYWRRCLASHRVSLNSKALICDCELLSFYLFLTSKYNENHIHKKTSRERDFERRCSSLCLGWACHLCSCLLHRCNQLLYAPQNDGTCVHVQQSSLAVQ